jgi:hypothetical protein
MRIEPAANKPRVSVPRRTNNLARARRPTSAAAIGCFIPICLPIHIAS